NTAVDRANRLCEKYVKFTVRRCDGKRATDGELELLTEPCFHREVAAKVALAVVHCVDLWRRKLAAYERNRRAARDFRRVEEKQFVDDLRRQRRAVKSRAGFEQHTQNLSASQF